MHYQVKRIEYIKTYSNFKTGNGAHSVRITFHVEHIIIVLLEFV